MGSGEETCGEQGGVSMIWRVVSTSEGKKSNSSYSQEIKQGEVEPSEESRLTTKFSH